MIFMDISIDIHIHCKPGYKTLLLQLDLRVVEKTLIDLVSRKNAIIHYNHCQILIAPVTRSQCQAMICNAMNAAWAPAEFLRATARNASRVLAIVEVSVRPSVTRLSPVKTMQIFTESGSSSLTQQ